MVTGVAHAASVSGWLATQRHCRWAGVIDDAGAGRHGLCGGIRLAGDLRPLRHDRTAAGLCSIRPEPHPGSRTRLIARRRHTRRRFAIVCWRPAARGGAGRNDGGRLRDRLHSGRCRAVGLYHRASLQANSLWLHERHRIDRSDQPAAQTFRLFDRDRGSAAQPVGYRRGRRRWQDELDRARNRRRQPCRDPVAQEQQTDTGDSRRRGGRDSGRGCV